VQVTRGYRTELDLNNKQITACKKHAGAARYTYNWGLKRKQEALRDLDVAFTNFFRRMQLKKEGKWKGPSGYPKFKTKRNGLGSFRLTGSIHVYEQAIDLPRLGRLRLKECGYVPTSGVNVLSATISEEAGRWFVSVQVEEEVPDPPAGTSESIGIDVGINRLAQCSDGRVVENPKALRSELKRLKRLHRRLSRKRKGKRSGPVDPPPLPENIARQVKEKRVKRLLRLAQISDASLRPAVAVLEDLNVDGMKRNRKLALSISDVGLGEFRRQMGYKTVWQGETLLLADRWFPSTKMCSRCGNVKEEMDLSERIYVCENPACGLVIDRDLNAALNLAALARPSRQPGPYREFLGKGETPVERGALADRSQDGSVKLPSAKQEPDTNYGLSIVG
jgi:putative transposase